MVQRFLVVGSTAPIDKDWHNRGTQAGTFAVLKSHTLDHSECTIEVFQEETDANTVATYYESEAAGDENNVVEPSLFDEAYSRRVDAPVGWRDLRWVGALSGSTHARLG